MTFVSDNTTYIQGDFNLHTTDGQRTGLVEEFTDTILDGDFNNNDFYNNRTANELNLATFADFEQEHWRPVEILTDALTVLSADFVDGAIDDGYFNPSDSYKDSSFSALTRPHFGDLANWVREDVSDATSPIWVDRNGTFYYNDGGTIKPYYDVADQGGEVVVLKEDNNRRKSRQPAVDTYVNAVFVGSIVPERPNQAYGGLHNYPRFLENWNNDDLFISGAFIQLNFSTSATAPFDQDTWEPSKWGNTASDIDLAPVNDERIPYYDPPNRRWGFDVGLLYNSPAPAAERFNEVGRQRSEYYRELPTDDPYVVNLTCATDPGNSNAKIFPNLCP
jgi:hypothetical protein